MKNKINFSKLFYDNKFAITFSLIVSFIIWIFVSSSNFEEQEKLISDIPITIPLSDEAKEMGLKVFSGGDEKAEVKVSGNRVSLGMVSRDDIQIIAKQASSTIVSPGTYALELTANKKGSLKNYEFSSAITPRIITVKVDTEREVNLNIDNEIKYDFDPSYFAATTNFSDSKVTISGPESKIKTISRVSAKKDVEGILKSTVNMTVPLTVYDSFGLDITKDPLIQMSIREVNVTIPILFTKKVSVVPEILNVPEKLKVDESFAKVEPKEIEIAGPEDVVSSLSEVKLSPIDISKINLENKSFDLNIELPNNCRTMNNNYSANLQINTDHMKTNNVTVKNISFINVPKDKKVKAYTDSILVQMVGTTVNELNSDNVFAEVDLKDQQSYTGTKELPAKILTKINSGCWAYGEFTVNVGIE